MDRDLAARLDEVDGLIGQAARNVGRDPASLTRIVVTKFHPASLVSDLASLGVRDVGENQQQELTTKRAELPDLDVRWHFIGQVQTNKARAVRAAASVVHSVDRVRLADALDAAAPDEASVLDVLLQVNLTGDPGRGGVAPEELARLAEHVSGCRTLARARHHGRRPARRGPRVGVRAAARLQRPAPHDRAGRPLDLRRNDGGLRRSDRGRRDTPADRLGNHGTAHPARLTSNQTSTR